MQIAATGISKLLNPFTMSMTTIIVAIWVQQVSSNEKILWLVLGFFLSIVPMAVLYFDYKRGAISSLWSPTAPERRNSYVSWIIIAAIFSAVAFWQEAPRLIEALGLVFLSLGVINLMLTSSFKISVHSELISLFVVTTILSVSVSLIYLVALIFLVGWARLYLKAHTLSEITTGAFLAIFTVYFIFSFFGLATF